MIKKIITISIIVLLVLVTAWAIIFRQTLYNRFVKINIQGTLINAETNEPMKEVYTVIYAKQRVKSDENGSFALKKIAPNAILEIAGPGLFMPVKYNVNNQKKPIILLNIGLNKMIDPFSHYLLYRQYNKVYVWANSETKADMPETAFVRLANTWADTYSQKNWKLTKVELIQNNEDSENPAYDVKWVFSNQNNELVKNSTTSFTKEGNGWVWVYEDSFFPN